MTKLMTGPLTAAVATALVVGVTILQGTWTERWANRDDGGRLREAAQLLEAEFPEQFGTWQMEQTITTDAKELERAGAVGSISRIYRDTASKVVVSTFVVCAAPHDASGHTPDRCYPGAGFTIGEAEHRHEVPVAEGRDIETFTGTFVKDGQTLRIFWTYGVPWKPSDGTAAPEVAPGEPEPALRWIAPGIARIALAGEPAVYKLYAIIDQSGLSGSEAMTLGTTFLSQLLPAFDAGLTASRPVAADGESTAGAPPGTPKADAAG